MIQTPPIRKQGKIKHFPPTCPASLEHSAYITCLHRLSTTNPQATPLQLHDSITSLATSLPPYKIPAHHVSTHLQTIHHATQARGLDFLTTPPSLLTSFPAAISNSTPSSSSTAAPTTLPLSPPPPQHQPHITFLCTPGQDPATLRAWSRSSLRAGTPGIFIHQGPPSSCDLRSLLTAHSYSIHRIPAGTLCELSSKSCQEGTYNPAPSKRPWTIWAPRCDHETVAILVDHLTHIKKPRTHHDDSGLWPIFNGASQYAAYIHTTDVLAATDGSASKDGVEMGGGVAFRYGDGESMAIPIRGIPSSLDAEAGAGHLCLELHDDDTPLTILTDSYNLLQLIQNSLTPGTSTSLQDHEHAHILLPFMAKLFARTAPTTWVKVKSHRGALLNEAADFYADKGRSLPFTGPLPTFKTPEIQHWALDDAATPTPYASTSASDASWKAALHDCARQRHLRGDTKTTTEFMLRPGAGREHIKHALTSTAFGMKHTSARHFLQAYCGTYPTMHKLHQYGQVDSPDCPFCPGVVEHMAHWQCICPQHRLSRTSAHNHIWQTLSGSIQQHADKHWTIKVETPLSATGLKHSPAYTNWRPDGLAYRPDTKTLYVLEFTRCSDSRQSSLLIAMEKKELKYDVLLRDLQRLNPHLTVLQLTFAVGYLGTIDDRRLRAALLILGIDTKEATATIRATITATLAAFGKMGRERWAALGEHKRAKRATARVAVTAKRRRRRG